MDIAQGVLINIVIFFIGFFTGFIFRGIIKLIDDNDNFYRNLVISCVVVIWSISVIVDILSINYETSFALHGLMGGIVGFFFRPVTIK